MLDTCKSLGITKLNTTSYHPECDGMVERFKDHAAQESWDSVGQASFRSTMGVQKYTPRYHWREAILPAVWLGLSL